MSNVSSSKSEDPIEQTMRELVTFILNNFVTLIGLGGPGGSGKELKGKAAHALCLSGTNHRIGHLTVSREIDWHIKHGTPGIAEGLIRAQQARNEEGALSPDLEILRLLLFAIKREVGRRNFIIITDGFPRNALQVELFKHIPSNAFLIYLQASLATCLARAAERLADAIAKNDPNNPPREDDKPHRVIRRYEKVFLVETEPPFLEWKALHKERTAVIQANDEPVGNQVATMLRAIKRAIGCEEHWGHVIEQLNDPHNPVAQKIAKIDGHPFRNDGLQQQSGEYRNETRQTVLV